MTRPPGTTDRDHRIAQSQETAEDAVLGMAIVVIAFTVAVTVVAVVAVKGARRALRRRYPRASRTSTRK